VADAVTSSDRKIAVDDKKNIYVLTGTGALEIWDSAGKLLRSNKSLKLNSAQIDSVELASTPDHLLIFVPQFRAGNANSTASGLFAKEEKATNEAAVSVRLIAVTANEDTPKWESTLSCRFPRIQVIENADEFYIYSPKGEIAGVNRKDGRAVPSPTLISSSMPLNYAACPLSDRRFASSSLDRLQVTSPDGNLLWTYRARGKRGVSPPAYTCLSATGDGKQVMAGLTDGFVEYHDTDSGQLIRRVMGFDSIDSIQAYGANDCLAVCSSGFVYRISNDKMVWSFNALNGKDVNPGIRVVPTQDGIWVACSATNRLVLLNPTTGKSRLQFGDAKQWAMGNNKVYILKEKEIEIYEIN
jgi:WD40 repeat protein